MSEIDLMRQIQFRASELGHRLFRNNVGTGWVGPQTRVNVPTMVRMYPGDVLIRKASALHAGLCTGSSDQIGLTKDGIFLAVETKAPKGRPSDIQESFLAMVKRMNGIGIIARKVEDFNV